MVIGGENMLPWIIIWQNDFALCIIYSLFSLTHWNAKKIQANKYVTENIINCK